MIEHLVRLMSSEAIEEVWELHVAKMAEYGFDRLLYGFTRFRTGNRLGHPDDLLVLSNHDTCYIEAFVHGGMYQRAPMVRWAAEHVGACPWSWVVKNQESLSPEELRIIEFNKSQGLTAGYSISFPETSTRSKGAIGLAAPSHVRQREVDAVWAVHGREIEMLNHVAHLKIASLPYTSENPLTPRQREVLEWVGDGKTTQDIATILGVTPATVEKHLRLARDALKVETTAQAVLKASFKNQIYVV